MHRALLVASFALACGKPPGKEPNRPPQIVDPAPETPARVGNGPACELTFSATLADPDASDVLFVKWFVDDKSQSAAPVAEAEARPGAPVSLKQLVGSASSPLHASGAHTVELLVADGLLIGREPQPRQRLSDQAQIETYAVTHAWTVEVEQGKNCP